ncbi:MAG: hypothetical protein R2824_26900 [Saprospiraceae bacterium]|nr:hypothetical protein [Lewinella sp.]
MKIHVFTKLFFGLLLGAICLTSCGTNQGVGKSERTIDYTAMSTLADALRVQSGVQVVGSQHNIKVTIRGVNSSRSTTGTTFVAGGTGPKQRETTVLDDVEPLFVIDNTIVGNTYNAAATAVNVQDITEIKVLKSYSETNAYGESGKNGVIKITTKMGAASK